MNFTTVTAWVFPEKPDKKILLLPYGGGVSCL